MPGGRLIECTTTRSIAAPSGRAPKLGEATRWAKRYQPWSHRASLPSGRGGLIGFFAARRGDGEARDAIADLAQAQSQLLGGGGAVEVGLAQGLDQDLALLLVQVGLQVVGHGGGRCAGGHGSSGG